MSEIFSRMEIQRLENTDILVVGMEYDGLISVALVEPVTWGWVATKLGEAAASYVAGRLLSEVFGGADQGGQIHAAIRAAVVELKVFVRAELERNVIEDCSAWCDSAWRDLLDYQDLPEHRGARLDNALTLSRNAMMRLDRVGRVALGPYVHAVSIHVIAQEADALRLGKPEAWLSTLRTLTEGINLVSGWLNGLDKEHRDRRLSVSNIAVSEGLVPAEAGGVEGIVELLNQVRDRCVSFQMGTGAGNQERFTVSDILLAPCATMIAAR